MSCRVPPFVIREKYIDKRKPLDEETNDNSEEFLTHNLLPCSLVVHWTRLVLINPNKLDSVVFKPYVLSIASNSFSSFDTFLHWGSSMTKNGSESRRLSRRIM